MFSCGESRHVFGSRVTDRLPNIPAASTNTLLMTCIRQETDTDFIPLAKLNEENQVQITTTPSIEGKRITKYCGVLAGEAILGANLFKDLFAGIRDLVGGRSATYERELQRAREIALQELQQRAEEAGANAVVGVDLDYEVLGQNNGMLMVSASGTAVVVE